MRRRVLPASLVVAVLLSSTAVTPTALAKQHPATVHSGSTLLGPDELRYPRVIRLEHSGPANGRILASVTSYTTGTAVGTIYQSTDDGATFQQLSTVNDPLATGTLCCTHLYELPQQLGTMAAGTLLWAATIEQRTQTGFEYWLPIWRSSDQGRTWFYLSSCGRARGGALWEPELSMDAYGRLVCHFSDETENPAHSQLLTRTLSTDGLVWSEKTPTVASGNGWHRPGMVSVRRLPNNSYYMIYELCAQAGKYFCAAYYRVSNDGWDWGYPKDLGTLIQSFDGKYFAHTPTMALVRATGRLVLTGQMLMNADGTVAASNGATLFVNDTKGHGEWTEWRAPVAVPGARDDGCPNYSPTLLPSTDGSRVLEITTDYGTDKVCRAHYATGSLPAGR